MDETPEELEAIRREAEAIDPHKYRRRYRRLMALAAALFFGAIGWVVVRMAVESRNPCERVRDHYCRKAVDAAQCSAYQGVFRESVEDESPKMRGMLRDQCLTKITRLKEEAGVTVE